MVKWGMTFIEEVAATTGGGNILSCIQCGVCVASCPVASKMEYPPRKIITLIRAGMRDEVLSSSSMWHCLSCYMCTVRCPRDVMPTELAHTLESLASRYSYIVKGTRTPAMYRSFVSSMINNGRIYEFGTMLKFYLSADLMAALRILPIALKLLRHRRLPLRPYKASGRRDLARIVKKFREIRGSH